MCGIAGATRNMLGDTPDKVLNSMNQVMIHRGPDTGDIFLDSSMGLCHRRLSIIDLSEDGRQPMTSSDGRYAIVFNGEIYNFLELREKLSNKGYNFCTKTDTEVLLVIFKEYGPACLDKIRGMFAFAIWDRYEKKLFAARDRIGKKPLYFYFDKDRFAFSSEIKSLLEIKSISKEIDPTAIADYLKYLFIPHPKSIYKNISKLEPGHYLLFEKGKLQIRQYWDVDFSKTLAGSEDDIAHELLSIISDSVKTRLISDVPLGAFLSGGIDSSAVVALMTKEKRESVKTCTIGFDDSKHNEAIYAKDFSEQYHTEHHEYYVNEEEALGKTIRKLVWHFDEPFADSSMVPTYHVSRVARNIVTVALSGDGGDENFGGYGKYVIDQIENRVRRFVPYPLLSMICSAFSSYEKGVARKAYSLANSARLSPVEGFYLTNTFFSDEKLKELLSDRLIKEINDYNPFEQTSRYYNKASGTDHFSKVLYTDLKSYLPGDILVKVDRMSMANSLEVRSPLLDHKVIEFAARIPSALKIRGKNKKIILKKAFEKILPAELMNRPKHGFDVPLDNWFRRELKQMAYNYLLKKEYMDEFFKVPQIKIIWDKHQKGRGNFGTNLWTLFIFSLWHEEFIGK